jgi:hypothetical protein
MEIIGRREMIHLPEWGGFFVPAKIDTGAFRTAVHCESCTEIQTPEGTKLKVIFDWENNGQVHSFEFSDYKKRIIKNSFGQTEERFCLRTIVKIGLKSIRSEISLTDRSGMKYPILLGRKTIGKKFLVDVSKINLQFM